MIDTSKMKKVELEKLIMEQSETITQLSHKPTNNKFKIGMTVALGCGIPLLSLAFSYMAGRLLLTGFWPLAFFAFALMVTVLSVSLPHLSWAIQNITKSDDRASWALAVALDLSLVLGELCHVWASEIGINGIVNTVMFAVCVFSMLLNCWAFLKHDGKN